jgi:lipopolysaccharide/colanic/teichoic acid biosynthesis glycosyltransferase
MSAKITLHSSLDAARKSGVALELPSPVWFRWKSWFDYSLAALLLIVSAPVILLLMALVRLTSRGPAIYRQKRLGQRGREFTIYKIRTMYDRSEQQTGVVWSWPGDPRITPVGRWLRATHLDELPQLVNILLGEMSLVGPRPERPEIANQIEHVLPHYHERLLVRPGITGLAQIQLPPDGEVSGVRSKLFFDLHHVQNHSFSLDFRILLGTGLKVLGFSFPAIRRLLNLPICGHDGTQLNARLPGYIANDRVPAEAAPLPASGLTAAATR